MKLSSFDINNAGEDWIQITFNYSEKEAENLYVIGTCGECKHHPNRDDDCPIYDLLITESWTAPDSKVDAGYDELQRFGCIYFKKRE